MDELFSKEPQPSNIEYQKVAPKYVTQLRIESLFNWGVTIVAALVISWFVSGGWRWLGLSVAAIGLLILLLLVIVWAPRRYVFTGYAVLKQEVHYRTGALWRVETAVPINRIQHVEITQGPIERMLGLARLVLYTAGGSGSDLAVPGLPANIAEQWRTHLLGVINDTAPTVEDITN